MPTKRKAIRLGKWSILSVTLLLLMLIAPMPFELRQMIAGSLALGWLLFGITWLVRRFGKLAIVALAVVGISITGSVWYVYWLDEPNRQLVAQIRECNPSYVGTTSRILVGNVDYVYFDARANDDDVRKFTELEGLNHLNRLVLKGTVVKDATAKRFSRFSHLGSLYIEGSVLSDETIDYLVDELPNCRIEVK